MSVRHPQNSQPSAEPELETGRGCLPALVRLVWIFGGIALVYLALYIALGKGSILTELLVPILALGLILVRYADIRHLKGETLDNKPATLKHWRRYAVLIAVAAGLLYALGKFIAANDLL
ncbi:MAG TPA: hypothetical protein P5119_11435 [Candidatus Aminicenantes bacterium]|nr:hypothetical protein [Candidatus Aminicenantes bacterium]HRY65935.1 hypothetical protein [Candidatus Aminicenantes bacterium]HRZ72739.1 hypothetical protein [Candidatus Aminicenantes bacterium]